MQLNADKQAYQPFLLKYELAEEFIPEYLATGSLANFTGKVSKTVLSPISRSNRQNTAALDPAITLNGTTCPGSGVTYTGGVGTIGGGGWSTDPINIEDPDTVTTVTCTTYMNYTVWRNADGSINNIQYHGIEVDCEETPGGGSTSSDNDGACAPLSGEIPILTPVALTLDPKLKDFPCTSRVIEKLMTKENGSILCSIDSGLYPKAESMTGHLSQYVLDLFKGSTNFNYHITVDNLGYSNGQPLNGRTREITRGSYVTYLDRSMLRRVTDLSIARTLIHESMHAHLSYLTRDRGVAPDIVDQLNELYHIYRQRNPSTNHDELAHHEFMAQMVEGMAYSLSFFDDHFQQPEYYQNLVWGGLQVTDAYKKLNNAKRREIEKITYAERNNTRDAKGNDCD